MVGKLKNKYFQKKLELEELEKRFNIFSEFIKYIKPGDIIYMTEIMYDLFCNEYHELEVQDTSQELGIIYCIERTEIGLNEHYLEDLDFYLKDSNGLFIKSDEINNINEIEKICKINRKR